MLQVDIDANSLNSNDVFVLKLPQNNGYTWLGKGASQDEEKGAEYLTKVLKCKTTKIQESEEPGEYCGAKNIVTKFCAVPPQRCCVGVGGQDAQQCRRAQGTAMLRAYGGAQN